MIEERQRTVKVNKQRTAITVEDLYKAHSKLLDARAYKISALHGVPYEELRSEANVAFVKALWKYDTSRGWKFITFLYVVTNNQLMDFCKAWNKQLPAHEEFEDFMDKPVDSGLERLFALRICLKKLTKEAQGVASIVLNCPDELLEFSRMCGVKTYKEGLQLYLLKLGWQADKIQVVFDELSAGFKRDFKRLRTKSI